MSFILDALKKSEAERQRQAGPTLLEVRITRPRRRYPLWAAIVGALLAVNALVLVASVLHRPAAPAALPVAQSGSEAAVPAPSAAASPKAASTAATAAAASPAVPAAATAAATAAAAPIRSGAAAEPAPPEAGTIPSAPAQVAPLAASAGANPADEQPALPAGSVQVERASASNYSHLPSISQISGNVPALRLDLLDYSDRANERYALINMRRVREGDVLPEGPRVLAITREGVALDFQGQDFMLRPSAQ